MASFFHEQISYNNGVLVMKLTTVLARSLWIFMIISYYGLFSICI